MRAGFCRLLSVTRNTFRWSLSEAIKRQVYNRLIFIIAAEAHSLTQSQSGLKRQSVIKDKRATISGMFAYTMAFS